MKCNSQRKMPKIIIICHHFPFPIMCHHFNWAVNFLLLQATDISIQMWNACSHSLFHFIQTWQYKSVLQWIPPIRTDRPIRPVPWPHCHARQGIHTHMQTDSPQSDDAVERSRQTCRHWGWGSGGHTDNPNRHCGPHSSPSLHTRRRSQTHPDRHSGETITFILSQRWGHDPWPSPRLVFPN